MSEGKKRKGGREGEAKRQAMEEEEGDWEDCSKASSATLRRSSPPSQAEVPLVRLTSGRLLAIDMYLRLLLRFH